MRIGALKVQFIHQYDTLPLGPIPDQYSINPYHVCSSDHIKIGLVVNIGKLNEKCNFLQFQR